MWSTLWNHRQTFVPIGHQSTLIGINALEPTMEQSKLCTRERPRPFENARAEENPAARAP